MELMPVEIITRFVLTVQIFLQRGLLVEHLRYVHIRTYAHVPSLASPAALVRKRRVLAVIAYSTSCGAY